MVYIKPMTAAEKDVYEPGWHPRMNKYEGNLADYNLQKSLSELEHTNTLEQ